MTFEELLLSVLMICVAIVCFGGPVLLIAAYVERQRKDWAGENGMRPQR